jgi:hypothetical protein
LCEPGGSQAAGLGHHGLCAQAPGEKLDERRVVSQRSVVRPEQFDKRDDLTRLRQSRSKAFDRGSGRRGHGRRAAGAVSKDGPIRLIPGDFCARSISGMSKDRQASSVSSDAC